MLCSLLAECIAPDDTAVVRGLCASLFLNLPPEVRAEKYEDLLSGKGMCYVRTLGRLTEQRLIDWGVPDGHAMMLIEVLHPTQSAAPSESEGSVEGLSSHREVRFVKAPAFPDLGTDNLPSASTSDGPMGCPRRTKTGWRDS